MRARPLFSSVAETLSVWGYGGRPDPTCVAETRLRVPSRALVMMSRRCHPWQAGSLSQPMPTYSVLFVGRANAGRTLMAEALVSRWGAPRLAAISAGLEPGTEVDEGAAVALRRELYAAAHRPRLLSDLLATIEGRIDIVVAIDPVDDDLGVPGSPPVVRWHVDDPRLHSGGEKDRLRAWRFVLWDLEERIRQLASPPEQQLDEVLIRDRALSAARTLDGPPSPGI